MVLIYCVPCLLIGDQLNAFTSSMTVKIATGRIQSQKCSQHHRSSVVAMKVGGCANGRIDRLMVEERH